LNPIVAEKLEQDAVRLLNLQIEAQRLEKQVFVV
jgi:hypothetical protein